MKYKKSIIIIMLTIFIFAIASASASDVNETAIASEDTTAIELSQSDDITVTDESQKTIQTNDTEMLTASDEETTAAQNNLDTLSLEEKTYADLSNAVGSGGDINLQPAYYKYNGESDTISITNPGIINGNGAIIDMAGSNILAFDVSALDVTIKNLTIKNANSNNPGGAIYFSHSGSVINCNFVNNSAAYGGGAVYFFDSGSVINCNFINNSAKNGGAIYFCKDCTVKNCNFTNNKAFDSFRSGGAVYFCSLGNAHEIINCNFTNNSAYYSGAIHFDGEGNVTNCNFFNNTASRYGGAISMVSGNITNCNFTNNKAFGSNSYGGAVNLVKDCTVKNCNFTNNAAKTRGGAVYFYSQGSAHEIINCKFTNNAVTDGEGGAIYCENFGTVRKSYFKGNSANNYSDIYCGSELVSQDNTFINTSQETNSNDAVDIAKVKLTLSKKAFTYNAKVQKPTVTLTDGAVLKEGVDYTLKWSSDSPKNAGTYTITLTGTGAYTGTAKVTFKINKAANPLKVKAKTVKVKFSKLKKKAQKLKATNVVKFTKKGQGTLTYKKVKGNKKITINKKTGKVTIKKDLNKGTYKVKVKIQAKGNANYMASAFKTFTFKIIIK